MATRKRRPVRLGRLRQSVRKLNMMYGLFVTEIENWRGRITELEERVRVLERAAHSHPVTRRTF
jgi:hypothetical protein